MTVSLDFRDGLRSEDVEDAVGEMERRMKAAESAVRRVYIEAQSWEAHRRDRLRDRDAGV